MITIIPGISEEDFPKRDERIARAAPFSECIHIDVQNEALFHEGSSENFSFVKKYPSVFFEAHCVVQHPELFVKTLFNAGIHRIVAPVECTDPREFISEARVFEAEIGLSMDVETPLEEMEPFLEELDFVHVMTAGALGMDQPFEERALANIKRIRRNLPDLPIVAEGGIDQESIKLVVESGATRIISTSFIFHEHDDVGSRIQELQNTIAV